MTIVYIIVILFQLGVIVYFVRGRKKNTVIGVSPLAPDGFEAKRIAAMRVTPELLKLAVPESDLLVYGVVMDWNMGDAIVTLVSYITGAAAMYISTGGGVDSAGDDPGAGEAASEFVVVAQDYLGRAIQASSVDLPPVGCVRFNLLTNKGTYAAQEQVKYFDDGSSPWTGLFHQGNGVIAEMRKNRASIHH